MLRLAHRITSRPPLVWRGHDGWTSNEEVVGRAKRDSGLMPGASAIIATNVCTFLYNEANVDRQWRCNDFPSIKAPFEDTWIEWEPPEGHGSCLDGIKARQIGVMVSSFKMEDQNRADGIREYQSCSIWFEHRGRAVFTGGWFICWLSEAGSIIKLEEASCGMITMREVQSHSLVAMMTLRFMHVKNVVKTDVTERDGPAEKWLRRQRQPRIRYHVLKIDPSACKNKSSISAESEESIAMAECLVRGNFATYTDDKPLFGKYSGTFWRPAHLRGDPDNGIVLKDYAIK